jgi:hypothetical protein
LVKFNLALNLKRACAFEKIMKKNFFLFLITSLMFVGCTDEAVIEPDVNPKDKFLGTWTVKEEIVGQADQNYTSTITEDATNTSRIKIGNIYNLGTTSIIYALVAGNSLDISSQTITGISISGTGSYLGTSIILNYIANDGSGAINVKATYTK